MVTLYIRSEDIGIRPSGWGERLLLCGWRQLQSGWEVNSWAWRRELTQGSSLNQLGITGKDRYRVSATQTTKKTFSQRGHWTERSKGSRLAEGNERKDIKPISSGQQASYCTLFSGGLICIICLSPAFRYHQDYFFLYAGKVLMNYVGEFE